jgi:hypothetical protein
MNVGLVDPTARTTRGLLLLLDGVAYERVRGLYEAGCFRAFCPPARLISVFPTLTDPAYDVLFETGPTPGYEAGRYDRTRNRTEFSLWQYVRGRNETWVQHVDYRLSFWLDAVMYLLPRLVYRVELRRARRRLDQLLAAGRQEVRLYVLSTDGLGHMLRQDGIDRELRRLDAWVEEVRAAYPDLEIVMLADHGLGRVPSGWPYVRRFDLAGVLRAAGLRVRRRLRRTGDVVLPVLGLLDVARLHCFDEETRARVVAAVRQCPEVEVVAARRDEHLEVYAGDAHAVVRKGVSLDGAPCYSYEPGTGDPLQLSAALGRLKRNTATADEWLAASVDLSFPAAPVRLWTGMCELSHEHPDVVVSLTDRWFVGSGLLNGFVRMRGTHGGLHRRVSETFVMGTHFEFTDPSDLAAVAARLRARWGWNARVRR